MGTKMHQKLKTPTQITFTVKLDNNCISCLVNLDFLPCLWIFSCIYAPFTPLGRFAFWSSLTDIGNSFNGACLLTRDFNYVLSHAEKRGVRNFGTSSHNDFVDFVQSNALLDLRLVGNKFTWSNHCSGWANIRERLDRGLANHAWVQFFPNALINHLSASYSDHCPILLSTSGTYQNIPKPFRFEVFWTRDQSRHSVVAKALLPLVEGSPAFSLSKKWKNTKNALKSWNQIHFGNSQAKIKSLMADISDIQSFYPHSSVNASRKVVLQVALQEQLLREEVLWKQKSRELWLTCIDLNTKFFHASTA
jgi:hypothetical protein